MNKILKFLPYPFYINMAIVYIMLPILYWSVLFSDIHLYNLISGLIVPFGIFIPITSIFWFIWLYDFNKRENKPKEIIQNNEL